MAARLNTPADFALSGQADLNTLLPHVQLHELNKLSKGTNKQYGLLPPSMFESTRVGPPPQAALPPHPSPRPRTGLPPATDPEEPWKDLAKATAEVVALREENKKLRLDRQEAFQCHTTEPIRARVDIHHETTAAPPLSAAVNTVNISHVDQLIQRQVAEIGTLQQRLTEVEAAKQKADVHWESEAARLQAHHDEQLTALRKELDTRTERLTKQVNDKEAELSRGVAETSRKVAELQVVLSRCQGDAQSKAERHTTTVRHLEDRLGTTLKELEETKRVKEAELREAACQLSKLKTYVAETKTAHRSEDTWRRELDNLSSQMKMREEETGHLVHQLSLATVRLQAQERILTLQEAHLSKVKDDSTEKKKTVLLTRWREKVYELMVQAKTAEVATKHQEHNWTLKVADLTDMVQALEADVQVKMAAVEDKDAQLKMAAHQIATLESELARAHDVTVALDAQAQNHAHLVTQLAQFTHSLYQKYSETLQQLARVDASLRAYDQRLTFAAGRVHLLQGQFSRREARLKMEYEQEPTRDEQPQLQPDPGEMAVLRAELDRVTSERDALVCQQQEDAKLLEAKVIAARRRVESEVQELKDTTNQLQKQIDLKNQEIDALRDEVSLNQTELNRLQAELDRSAQQAASAESDIRKDATSHLEAERARMTETLAKMEHQINDCRREQTKAVVALRQLQRASTRDKERATQHLVGVEKDYRARITQLESKLQAAEKDRNILMTTLRQEGLVGQYRAQRGAPVTSSLAGEGDSADVRPAPVTTSTLKDAEPLRDVIDDLKSLTAGFLEDEEDSS